MSKISTLILLFFIALCNSAQANWTQTNIGFNDHFKSVFFWDADNGLVTGQHGIYYTSTSSSSNVWNQYIITTNQTDSVLLTRCIFTDIASRTNQVAYLCGSDTVNHTAVILEIDFNTLTYSFLYTGNANTRLNALEIIYNSTDHLMAVGDNGLIVASPDMTNFTTINSGTTKDLYSITNYTDYISAIGYIYYVAIGGDEVLITQKSDIINPVSLKPVAGANLKAVARGSNYGTSILGFGDSTYRFLDHGNAIEAYTNFDYGSLKATSFSNNFIATDHGIFIFNGQNHICEYQPSSNLSSLNDVFFASTIGYAVGDNGVFLKTLSYGGAMLPYIINATMGACTGSSLVLDGYVGSNASSCKWYVNGVLTNITCGSVSMGTPPVGPVTTTWVMTNSYGFSDTSTKIVYISPLPSINLPTSLTDTLPLCKQGTKTIHIQNTQTGFLYLLKKPASTASFGSVLGNNGTAVLNTSMLDDAGKYYIRVQDLNAGCIRNFTDSILISIEETKAILFHNLINAFPGEKSNFYAQSVDADSSSWTFSNSAIPTASTSWNTYDVSFGDTGQTHVTLIAVSAHGCMDTITQNGPYVCVEPNSRDTCRAATFTGPDPMWTGHDYNRFMQSSILPNGDMLYVGAYRNHRFTSRYGVPYHTPVDRDGGYLVKYSKNGTVKWANFIKFQFNPSSDPDAQISSVVTDSSGNIYIAGWYDNLFANSSSFKKHYYYQNSGDSFEIANTQFNLAYRDGFVAKLDSLGHYLWHINLTNGLFKDMELDEHQNIVCIGRNFVGGAGGTPVELVFRKSGGTQSLAPYLGGSGINSFILKLKNSGDFKWLNKFNSYTNNIMEGAEEIEIDSSDNIYVLGEYEHKIVFYSSTGDSSTILRNPPGYGPQTYLVKYDSSGVFKWKVSGKMEYTLGPSDLTPKSLEVDNNGTCYVVTADYWPNIAEITNADNSVYIAPVPLKSSFFKVSPQGKLKWMAGIDGTSLGYMTSVVLKNGSMHIGGDFSSVNLPSHAAFYSSAMVDSTNLPLNINGLFAANYDTNGHLNHIATIIDTNGLQSHVRQILTDQNDNDILIADIMAGTFLPPYTYNLFPLQNTFEGDGNDVLITHTTAGGCGNLIYNQSPVINPNTIIAHHYYNLCGGNSYTFPNGVTITNLNNDTLQQSNFISSQGYDSIIYTHIHCNQSYNQIQNITVCAGSGYLFPDGYYMSPVISNMAHTSFFNTALGCDSLFVTNLTVTTIDTSVVFNGISLNANNGLATYQWIDCTTGLIISGEINQMFTPLLNGNYALMLTQNGCTDTSGCRTVLVSGVNDIPNDEDMYLYPNPSHGLFYMVFGNAAASMPYAVYDIAGREIQSGVLTPKENLLDLSSYANGVYFLKSDSRLFKLFKK